RQHLARRGPHRHRQESGERLRGDGRQRRRPEPRHARPRQGERRHARTAGTRMTVKRALATDAAPKAIGPYSQAVVAGDLVFLSGQIALEPKDGRLVTGSIEDETRQVLTNLKHVLATEGLSLDTIVRTTVYLVDLGDFPRVNQTYA